jgi:hypothetical protein
MPDDNHLHRRTRLNPLGLSALTCAMCRRRLHPLPLREESLCPPCHEAMVDALVTNGIAQLERMLDRPAREE